MIIGRRTSEKQREVIELRRSNAAMPHKSPKSYNRHNKSWKQEW